MAYWLYGLNWSDYAQRRNVADAAREHLRPDVDPCLQDSGEFVPARLLACNVILLGVDEVVLRWWHYCTSCCQYPSIAVSTSTIVILVVNCYPNSNDINIMRLSWQGYHCRLPMCEIKAYTVSIIDSGLFWFIIHRVTRVCRGNQQRRTIFGQLSAWGWETRRSQPIICSTNHAARWSIVG